MYRSIAILLTLLIFTSAAEFSFCGKGGMGLHWPSDSKVQGKHSVVLSSSVMFNRIVGLQLDMSLMRYTSYYKDINIGIWNEETGTVDIADSYEKIKVRESYFAFPFLLRFEIPSDKVRPFFLIGVSTAFSPESWKSTVLYTDSERIKEDKSYSEYSSNSNSLELLVERASGSEVQFGIVQGIGIEIPLGPGFISVEERFCFIAKDLELLLGYGFRF